ncbi:alpha/beta hydrolase [Algivirga pacifica]|uniref:Alpha/beta hydrolase-fold protein n=1 Tax=Algivirga pacifica TaxID=1162670 RepID=A0ABP9CZK4_9BACT
MKILLPLLLFFTSIVSFSQTTQQASSGKIERIEHFPSHLVTPRNIDVWLPEHYDGKKKFSVLYMHDGQMLYDSSTTWNGQAWDVDDIGAKLMKEGKVKDFIVVGIWNPGPQLRHQNYFPEKPYEHLSEVERDSVLSQLKQAGRTQENEFEPISDRYLKFIVTELKPLIDQTYAVHTDKKHTFIAGSSMGGLISMYAFCEYPSVFGGAACLSTHWIGTFTDKNNPIPKAFQDYLKENLPPAQNRKIYFDCGDETLDRFYPPIQKEVDKIMRSHGYDKKTWMTRYYPGKNHSEEAWKERLHVPLIFLLGK